MYRTQVHVPITVCMCLTAKPNVSHSHQSLKHARTDHADYALDDDR